MACCNCGVIVSCWPSLSCREGLSIKRACAVHCRPQKSHNSLKNKNYQGRSDPSHTESLAQVHLTDLGVGKDLLGSAGCDHYATVDDVGAAADAQRLTHVMIGDQHADATRGELANNALDIEHRQRIDTRKRLVEQDKARL